MSKNENQSALPEFMRPWQDPHSRRKKQPTAADLLCCGKSTVFKLIKEGKLKAIKVGPRMTLIPRESVLALLNGSGAG